MAGTRAPGTPSPPNDAGRHARFRAEHWRPRAARESRRGTSGTPLAQPQREFETPPPRPAEIAAYSRPSSRLDAALAPLSAASQIPQPPPMSAETLVARFPGNPASPGTAARTRIPSPAPPSTPAISPAGFPPSPAATAA